MAKRAIDIAGNEIPVSNFVPYSHDVTESIIATRDGDYLCIFKFRGRTFETNATLEHKQWVEQLNTVLAGFRAEPMAYWTHLVRRRVEASQDSQFSDAWCAQYNREYQGLWEAEPPLVNDLYLTVVLRPDIDPALSKFARFEKRSQADLQAWQDSAIAKLENVQRVLRSSMREYVPELLQTYERDGIIFSQPKEFLSSLLNGRSMPTPLSSGYIHDTLPRSRPFFGRWGQVGELRDLAWNRRFGAIEIFQFGSRTKPAHVDVLLKLPFEFVLSQSFTTLFKTEARKAFKRQGRFMRDAKDDGVSQIDQLENARDDLASDKFIVGEHDVVMIVWGKDLDDIQAHQAEAIAALANSDITAKAIDTAIEPAWWSVLPCNWRWRLRPRVITSLNFLSLSPFHNYLYGKPKGNPWGQAVTVFRTEGSTATYFNFHASEEYEDAEGKRHAGNTSILGETGTGKTVLLGHLLAQSNRFGATMAIFDKDRGLQVATLAMGGRYYPMALGMSTGWNPLQLEPTPGNVMFMHELTVLLCELVDGALNGVEKESITNAIHQLTTDIPRHARRLGVLIQLLPNPRMDTGRLSVHQRLRQWCVGGPYGWLFDNPQDTLSLDTQLLGFDLTEFLGNPVIGSASMFYLLHRTEAMLDGRRFGYFFDECQYPLAYGWFQTLMQNKSRTIRKQNGILVFATQEPDAITKTPVGKSLIQQSATQVFLPNTKATPEDYIQDFRLTASEFEVVQRFGKHSRKFLVKQDGAVGTAMLDLSRLPHALNIFSGSHDKAELAEAAIRAHGHNVADWLPAYLASLSQL